jgi:prepilin signal peptidase PulO-like enzyme (type II secretory pathway)
MTILLAIALTALGAVIVWQDYRSLNIDAPLIYAFSAASLLAAVTNPLPGLDVAAHIIAGSIAAGVSISARLYFSKLRGVEALGEADVWLIISAGLLLGPFWLGPWLLGAATLGVILMTSGARISGKRLDPESEESVTVMPLTPVLIITMLIAAMFLHTKTLPANQLPFL